MRSVAAAAFALALVVTLATSASGADDFPARYSLRGLPAVLIGVEPLDDGEKRAGYSEETFRADAELKLRLAGIGVLTEEEWKETPGHPYLYLNVRSIAQHPNVVAPYAIRLELLQSVFLARNPASRLEPPVAAATWSVSSLGQGGVSFVRERVQSLSDHFIKVWLSVNPEE